MNNLQTISELCGICEELAGLVEALHKALAQYDALALEDEIARTRSRYTAVLGEGTWPKEAESEGCGT